MVKKLFMGLFLALALTGCNDVPSGYVGIKVFLYGGNKGVDHEILGVGRYWVGMNGKLYLFPTFQQNYPWTKSATEGNKDDESITFQTKEGMSINTDVGISYSINPDKIATIFQKYHKGVDELTDIVLRNAVRDTINKVGAQLTVEEAYSLKKRDFFDKVTQEVREAFAPIGVNIEKIYLIGEMRIPKEVMDALNGKIKAIQDAQRMQNEVAAARAQAEKTIVTAEAEAKANELRSRSISDQLVRYMAVEKWNGQLPTYSGGGSLPFLTMSMDKK